MRWLEFSELQSKLSKLWDKNRKFHIFFAHSYDKNKKISTDNNKWFRIIDRRH